MANSSLASVTVKADSGNYSGSGSRKKITNVCLHHMAGILTAQQCGNIFAKKGRKGSAHYGIGSDGKIGLYVDESCVAWHAGNWKENQCSVGVEISNDTLGNNWHVSDQSLALAVKLVADIMQRNGIRSAVKGETLTWHSMYSSTACPGDYIRSKLDYICEEVNKILNGAASATTEPATTATSGFLPTRGYWCYGDYDTRVGQLANFMYNTFPAYTKKAALGNYYGKNLKASITEFQKRTGLEADGCTGPITYTKLIQYGFKA